MDPNYKRDFYVVLFIVAMGAIILVSQMSKYTQREHQMMQANTLQNKLIEGCWYSNQGGNIIVKCPELWSDAGVVSKTPTCEIRCTAPEHQKYLMRIYRAGEEKQ